MSINYELVTIPQVGYKSQFLTIFILKTYIMTESRLTADCYFWAVNTLNLYGVLFHVPNELARVPGETKSHHIQRIMAAKAMGVTPGVADFILFWKDKSYVIELKLPAERDAAGKIIVRAGTLSKEQEKWHERVIIEGAISYSVWGLEEFKAVMVKIVGMEYAANARYR